LKSPVRPDLDICPGITKKAAASEGGGKPGSFGMGKDEARLDTLRYQQCIPGISLKERLPLKGYELENNMVGQVGWWEVGERWPCGSSIGGEREMGLLVENGLWAGDGPVGREWEMGVWIEDERWAGDGRVDRGQVVGRRWACRIRMGVWIEDRLRARKGTRDVRRRGGCISKCLRDKKWEDDLLVGRALLEVIQMSTSVGDGDPEIGGTHEIQPTKGTE
jgi:hypothetical protein